MPNPDMTQSAETRLIYAAIQKLEVDEILTREDVEEIVGKPYHMCYGPIRSAKKALMREEQRLVVTVPKVGLKRVQGSDVIDAAEKRSQTINRTARRAIRELGCVDVDLSSLSADERARFNLHASVMGALKVISGKRRRAKLERKFREAESELPLAKTLDLFKNGGSSGPGA